MNLKRNQLILNLKNLLEESSDRFSNYQGFPDFIFDKIPEFRDFKYKINQINLDSSRYKWLKESLNNKPNSVLDIGANLGFFSFSLINDLKIKVDLYEPYKAYYDFAKNLCDLLKFKKKMKMFNKCIDLDEISKIQSYDLIINLNILHHAGIFFDNLKFNEFDSWFEYSKTYLKKLRIKSKYLFFQVGNLANGKPIFETKDFFEVLSKLFKLSGWQIENIGIIKNLETMDYINCEIKELETINLFKCRRNKKTNLVDYFSDGKIIKSLPTGFAQRPILLCS